MTAHRYWKLDNLTTADGSGYVAGGEVYLRQTSGGTNEVPSSSASSSSYSSGPSVLYDGDSTTWWASNSNPKYLAFDYGTTPIDPVEILWQTRHDYYPQGCLGGDLYWSDTSITGPWTYKSSFSFSTWTTNGQTQTTSTILPSEMRVTEQHGYAVMAQTGEYVTEQHGFAVMLNTGEFVSSQYGYAVLVPSTFNRRRQVMIGSF